MRFFLATGLAVLPLAAFGFEPGSLGDDYRDSGHVQGCVAQGELPGCTIIAGGSQFVIPFDGPTPPEVMARLRGMAPLTWVTFRGDVLNVFDSYAEMALGAVAPAEMPDPYGAVVTALQGEWQSADDPEARVKVEGMIWTDLYGGEVMARSVISLGEGCSDGTSGARMLELFSIGSAEPVALCYGIEDVDAARMELTYAPRGNRLVFARP